MRKIIGAALLAAVLAWNAPALAAKPAPIVRTVVKPLALGEQSRPVTFAKMRIAYEVGQPYGDIGPPSG